MKKTVVSFLLVLMVMLSGCAGTSTVGNGKIDPVESATIRVAVGLAFQQMPSAIAPAYSVSTAILVMTSPNGQAIALPLLEDVVSKQIQDLKLDPLTQESMYDLLYLVKEALAQQLVGMTVPDSQKMIIVRDLIKIIQSSAAARMGIK
jgi:hypothetical protein